MDVLFECFMNLSFYAALILLFARLGKKDVTVRTIDCLTAATMGIGFLIGAISKWMTHPMKWTAALYDFGAVLSAMVLISLFHRKTVKNNSQEEERKIL